jgi:uncharacterized protein (TIGR02453 family)
VPHLTKDALIFLEELHYNNDRAWFAENKPRYERVLKEPFRVIVAEVITRMQRVDPDLQCTPEQAIFRIYRDVRFARDKSPYKDYASAYIASGGRKWHDVPGLYVHFSWEEALVSGGAYQPDKDKIDGIRRALVKDPRGFARIVGAREFKRLFGELEGDRLKRVPPEWREAAERQPYVANKEWYCASTMEPEFALREDLVDRLMEYYKAARPLNRFLARAMGGPGSR